MGEAKTLAEMREGWIDLSENPVYLGSKAVEGAQSTESDQGK